MNSRQRDLKDLQYYVDGIDKEVTMILQSLQWDRKHLLEGTKLVQCQYDLNHKIPPEKKEIHERVCNLKIQGYFKKDKLLPDLLNPNADSVVHLSSDEIQQILLRASQNDPTFKRVPLLPRLNVRVGCLGPEPLSLERLQATYTSDERRALHDAVVAAAPACHDLADLVLPCDNGGEKHSVPKSRAAVLAELRNMKRRRTRYRGAPSKNYSNVLRDLISTQMEFFNDTRTKTSKQASSLHRDTKFCDDKDSKSLRYSVDTNNSKHKSQEHWSRGNSRNKDRPTYERDRKDTKRKYDHDYTYSGIEYVKRQKYKTELPEDYKVIKQSHERDTRSQSKGTYDKERRFKNDVRSQNDRREDYDKRDYTERDHSSYNDRRRENYDKRDYTETDNSVYNERRRQVYDKRDYGTKMEHSSSSYSTNKHRANEKYYEEKYKEKRTRHADKKDDRSKTYDSFKTQTNEHNKPAETERNKRRKYM